MTNQVSIPQTHTESKVERAEWQTPTIKMIPAESAESSINANTDGSAFS